MGHRTGFSILIGIVSILTTHAQTERADTLKMKKEGEIQLNQEAVKSIEFNFLPQAGIQNLQPMMDGRKPWMEPRKDLPASPKDTTALRKKYIRMLPYSIWEYDNSHLAGLNELDTLTIRMKLNPENIKPLPGMGHGYIMLPAGMDQSVAPSNHPLGGFSFDKLLYENLTKRGRAIKRNRKQAKAWKIYENYIPTKEDASKWHENKKRIPRDTLLISEDSIVHHFMNTK